LIKQWREVWSHRDVEFPRHDDKDLLQHLIYADGFDTPMTAIAAPDWLAHAREIARRMHLKPTDSVFEVGCGGGAFLLPFYRQGHKVGGLDLSVPMLRQATHLMPGMNFVVGDAADLDVTVPYEAVVSNGVFMYFDDLSHAATVLERMVRKAVRAVAVCGVPDVRLQQECEAMRRQIHLDGEYDEKYSGLEHLYFDRDWFESFGRDHGVEVELFGEILQCPSARFRFTCILHKGPQ
jgi:SAM-dependent methyltransferase